MAFQASILINGFSGGNDDARIDTTVNLSNDNLGGEVTYLWQLLDQPAGAADALSVTNQATCTLRPKKEGTYLLRLTVADAQGNVDTNQVILGVRQLKSRQRLPAAGESFETNTSSGWKGTVNGLLAYLDNRVADPGIFVGVLGTNGAVAGAVCRPAGSHVLKSGLPGEEIVVRMEQTDATTQAAVRGELAVLIADLDGNAAPAQYAVCFFRRTGLIVGLTGNPGINDPVYVSDTGTIALTAGTVTRQLGAVCRSAGGSYDIFLQGGGDSAPPVTTLAGDVTGPVGASVLSKIHGNDLDSPAAHALLGLVIGVQVQAFNAILAAIVTRGGAGMASSTIIGSPFAPTLSDFADKDTLAVWVDFTALGGDLTIDIPKPSTLGDVNVRPKRLIIIDKTGGAGSVGRVFLTTTSGAQLDGVSLTGRSVPVLFRPWGSVELFAPAGGDTWTAPGSAGGMFVRRQSATIAHADLQALGGGVKTQQFGIGTIPEGATILCASFATDTFTGFDDGGGAAITVSTGVAAAPTALSTAVSIAAGGSPATPFPAGAFGAPFSQDASGQDIVAEFHSPGVDLNTFTSGFIEVWIDYYVL